MQTSNKIPRRKFIKLVAGGTASVAIATTMPVLFTSCSRSDEFTLFMFKEMSSVLTGFDSSELNTDHGSLYLKSLIEFPVSNINLLELYQDVMKNKDNLENSLIEKNDDYKKLATAIIECWYTASYKTADGSKVSDYNDMLAWKSTGYITPNAQCHGIMGFWANKPQTNGV